MSRVLIIDDTPEYIEMLGDILSDYEIFAAKDGKKGIQLAQKILPSVILLDINMPELNGYEVCRRLKLNKELQNIPVIFLTANEGTNFEEIGFEVGAVDFISKPFNTAILRARVSTHINLYKLQSNLKKEVANRLKEIKNLNKEMMYLAASIAEMKSKETGLHLKRVSSLSYLIAKKLGFSENEAQELKMASILHDIGKVAIPDHVLNKPEKLSQVEWEMMQKHAVFGYDMLKESDFELMHLAATISLEHHERWDGTGYPKGIKKEEISLVGRIVAVSDVFDSLLDKRVYKEAWSPEAVKSYFQDMSGKQFDPKITQILLEDFETFLETRNSLEI
ncbi:MAG: cyclic di-GMP phosphodiesterase [Sulfurospirillum sp.]|jgi:putative two-component system response regulator|nr:cyclic di-GMP phosphodiesterase [Sulfurospirillum sp.]